MQSDYKVFNQNLNQAVEERKELHIKLEFSKKTIEETREQVRLISESRAKAETILEEMKKNYDDTAQQKNELQKLLQDSHDRSQREIEKLKQEKEREIKNLKQKNNRLSSTEIKVKLEKSTNELFQRSRIVFFTAWIFHIIGISLITFTLILTVRDVFGNNSTSPKLLHERTVALIAGIATNVFGTAISRMQNQYHKQFTSLHGSLEVLALIEMLNQPDITELQQQQILEQIELQRKEILKQINDKNIDDKNIDDKNIDDKNIDDKNINRDEENNSTSNNKL